MSSITSMVQQAILVTSKAKCKTAVFGGYVRDILIGSDSPDQLNDLDIFIESTHETKRVIELLSIFWERVKKQKMKQNHYGATRTLTKCEFKSGHAHLSIDFVSFTNETNETSDVPFNPLCLQRLDFDVNTLFCPIKDGIHSIQVAHPKLNLIKVLERIKEKKFVTMSSPSEYPIGDGTIHGNAVRLVLRAEKMVLRGWTQDADTGNRPGTKKPGKTWFISRWAEMPGFSSTGDTGLMIPNILNNKCWDSNRDRIFSTTQCGICLEDFKAGQTVFVGPCGHPYHPCCADYSADDTVLASTTSVKRDRTNSGIVGCFVTGARTKRPTAQPSCPMCNANIFISTSPGIVIGEEI